MKILPVILSSCLWPLASSHPTPPSSHKFAHAIGTVSVQHKGTSISRATHFTALAAAAVAARDGSNSTCPVTLSPTSNFTFTPATAKPLAIQCTAGGSAYADATVPESAPAADCLAIAEYLADDTKKGYWTYTKADWARRNTTGFKMLAVSGACAFGVDVQSLLAESVPVGTDDAVVVIKGAVKRFTGNGTTKMIAARAASNGTMGSGATKLGAGGAFQCGVDPSTMVNWSLYHV
ncbi:hypothetical protein GGR53DRAFT_13485 [Hypoxylon sp. FL1150]|nr:hypothetical protein GGR53DRAFT_13485 [Hypoxylon sp. FL1150]